MCAQFNSQHIQPIDLFQQNDNLKLLLPQLYNRRIVGLRVNPLDVGLMDLDLVVLGS